ncbi:MAG: ATP-binding protein [Saprospiraceae bacterium]
MGNEKVIHNIKSPFKFLDAYTKEDKDIFFGREAETDELYDRVFETNLVLLYGASGTGKTSIILCGLGNRFDNSDWMPIFIRREDHILHALNTEILAKSVKKLDVGLPLKKRIRSLYLDYFKPIYLIFDQFEELFILGSKEEQTDFFKMIKSLLDESLQCKILISMREEYIAYLSDFEKVIPELFDNRQRIEKMSATVIKDVIVNTTEAFEIEIKEEETTVEMIIENLRDKRGIDLANLQVYLDRLYKQDVVRADEERDYIIFDPELVKLTGELEDVLSDFLDEQIDVIELELESKGVKKRGIPMDVLFALVTDNGTKQSMTVQLIKESLSKRKKINPEYIDYCIERFKQMRILRELSDKG